jgi:hypothetical protein
LVWEALESANKHEPVSYPKMKLPIETSTPIIKIRALNLVVIPVLVITGRFSTSAFVDDAVEGFLPPYSLREPHIDERF